MKDLIAALVNLVLPFDAVTGVRIVLDGINGRILIYDASNNLIISIAPTAGTDQNGNVVLAGIVAYRPSGDPLLTIRMTTDGQLQWVPAPGMPALATNGLLEVSGVFPAGNTNQSSGGFVFRVPSNHAIINALLSMSSPSVDGTVSPDASIGVERGTSGVADALCNSFRLLVDGFILKRTHISEDGSVQTEGWNNFVFAAGWAAGSEVSSYKLYPDGIVRLRGIGNHTAAGVPGAGSLVTTLPVGYRPAQYTLIPNAYDASATKGRVQVDTDGTVRVFDAPNDFPVWDGVQFSVI